MPPKKGTLNRRGVERRSAILDAAIELFAYKGYRATSMLDIAAHVGMTHGGVLHHFGSKEELLRAVVARREELTDFYKAESTSLEYQEFVERYLTTEGDFLEPEVLTRLIVVLRGESLQSGDPLHEHFDERAKATRTFLSAKIRAGQQRDDFRRDIDPDVKAAEILAFLMGLEVQWAVNPGAIERKAVFESYMSSLFEGLSPPE